MFILQTFTGILAGADLRALCRRGVEQSSGLNHGCLGWFIRAMHGWGSNFMVAIVLIHMVQVLLFGAYKFPRELTWIVGVFLLLMTLGMAFTGQVLRFDQDAYWGLGHRRFHRQPRSDHWPLRRNLMLGGPIIAGERCRDSSPCTSL